MRESKVKNGSVGREAARAMLGGVGRLSLTFPAPDYTLGVLLPLPGGSHEKCGGRISRAFGLDCARGRVPRKGRAGGFEPPARASREDFQLFFPAAIPYCRENAAAGRPKVHFAGPSGGRALGLSRDTGSSAESGRGAIPAESFWTLGGFRSGFAESREDTGGAPADSYGRRGAVSGSAQFSGPKTWAERVSREREEFTWAWRGGAADQ